MAVTYYVALPFIRTDDGTAPGEAQECPSEAAAIRRAEGMSRDPANTGAVAFKRAGDPNIGEFPDRSDRIDSADLRRAPSAPGCCYPSPSKEFESRISHRNHLVSSVSIFWSSPQPHRRRYINRPRRIMPRVSALRSWNALTQLLMKASKSGLMTSPWIVSMPCGYPG
jgi:hypothetical protein